MRVNSIYTPRNYVKIGYSARRPSAASWTQSVKANSKLPR